MDTLYFLIVVESFVFGAIWHNQSLRPERKGERPDPAVLFIGPSANSRKLARSLEVQKAGGRPGKEPAKASTI
jgi:hypothetical protein